MKIQRGIIGFNNHNEMIVSSPGHIYHLNNELFYSQSLADGDKVLGVIINDKLSICREFISSAGRFVFGYIQMELPKQLSILPINKFDPNTFNAFDSEYSTGEKVIVEIN